MDVDLRRELEPAMASPDFYPHPVNGVEVRETHISKVFLTGPYVYKIKKPVDFGFLDFTSLEKRRFYCEQELAVNRRLTRGVYLGVATITFDGHRFHLDGPGETVEHAVVMRQLPDSRRMSELLPAGTVDVDAVRRLAHKLVNFYRNQDKVDRRRAAGVRRGVVQASEENFRQVAPFLGDVLDVRQMDVVQAATRSYLAHHRGRFDRRADEGRIRDGHGDLRLDHVYVLADGEIQILDGIEFNPRLRRLDAASDTAFLAMDLDDAGHPELADLLLYEVAGGCEDPVLLSLVDFYKCYRAMVRCKVSCLRLRQALADTGANGPMAADARRYLSLAYRYALRFGRPVLWAVGGLPASGKSTLAEALAKILDLDWFRSDAIRKSLFGMGSRERAVASPETGIYSPSATGILYGKLFCLAQSALRQGRSVVIDATFSRQSQRNDLTRLAADCRAHLSFAICTAPDDVLYKRLAEREFSESLSDARSDHLAYFKERFEPISAAEGIDPAEIDGSGPLETGLLRLVAHGTLDTYRSR